MLEELLEIVASRAAEAEAARRAAQPRLASIALRREGLRAESAQRAASQQVPLHPMRVIHAARQAFPRESTVAFDVGVLAQGMAGAFPNFDLYEPRSAIVPSSFYGMGFSSAALPVARLVHPDRPALGFVGDGSFQMVLGVLPMAVEHRLPVTWCVLNDHALGSIWDGQQNVYHRRTIATTFEAQPDFARLAEACGCHGERVEQPQDVGPALARALQANLRGQPAVVDCIVARERLQASSDFFTRK